MAASFHQRFYPEIGAGGFSRIDGTVAFYNRVNALLKKEAVVLDYGAGRGFGHVEDPCEYRRSLCNFRSRIASVIGVDVDEAVMQNPALDEAYVFNPKDPLPIGCVDRYHRVRLHFRAYRRSCTGCARIGSCLEAWWLALRPNTQSLWVHRAREPFRA